MAENYPFRTLDSSGISSVFVSNTTYTTTSGTPEIFVNLTYLDSGVAHYDDIKCTIKNKGGLCQSEQTPHVAINSEDSCYSPYAIAT